MVSNYGRRRSQTERYNARQERKRDVQSRTVLVQSKPPFLGWCPDLPMEMAALNGYRDGYGVIGQPWRGGLGYYLRPDDGWKTLGTTLPLASGRACVGLADIRLDSGDYEGYAIHAGVTSTTAITMSRLQTNVTWATVTKDAAANTLQTDRDVLFDSCVFPYGAPTRSSAINQAVIIWAGSNEDNNPVEVLVTPDATGVGTYDELDRFSALDPFMAASVCTFESKVLFLNTDEAGTAYPFRLRYSAEGTADPDPAEAGSGYYEFVEFNRPGLKVRPIGGKVACYFGDGMAFLRPTGIPGDAFTLDYLTKERGLMSKGSVIPVADDVHFGIFTDGFWLVNSVGQWRRVGAVNVGGQSFDKFWATFISELAVGQRHRIAITYDAVRRMVRIAYPTTSEAENKNVVNITLNEGDDVAWRDFYTSPVTAWGRWATLIRSATTWADLDAAGTTWAELFTSGTLWSDFLAAYGTSTVIQANDAGYVFQRDPVLFTQNGVTPAWLLDFHPLNASPNINTDQILRAFYARYRDVQGPGLGIIVSGNGDYQQSISMALTEGATTPYTQETLEAQFYIRASSHGLRLTGTAPFLIGGFATRFELEQGMDLRGQTT
jgi:hypothetical protein